VISLSPEQRKVVNHNGHLVVTACPGSGKTRVLTCRVIRGLEELESSKHRVVALTFTNRASDEIQVRLDRVDVDRARLWSGTIHAFALDWILRPYAPYLPETRRGWAIADEYQSARILTELKERAGKPTHFDVNTTRNRNGEAANACPVAVEINKEYRQQLRQAKLLDYDDVLYFAYSLLVDGPEIAATLARIIRLFCIDEIQDTQDLQYGIVEKICRATDEPPVLFFVGDPDQAIYESLGAVTKTARTIAQEFSLDDVREMGLTGNYRSTQRLIDFYKEFRPGCGEIQSLTDYAEEHGLITFRDQSIDKADLPGTIAGIIQRAVSSGVPQKSICVVAPHWWHVRSLARSLINLLPGVDFDAPGLSPLHCQRDNIWFKLARLFLTTPSPPLYRTRIRWAAEVIRELKQVYQVSVPREFEQARGFLRLVNSVSSSSPDGLEYLSDCFSQICCLFGVDWDTRKDLEENRDVFFEKARDRLDDLAEDAPADVDSFKKLLKHPSGVVVNTRHGIKGEEYEVVIAFGLLRGYVPNWQVIIHGASATAHDRASKLLYVVCSRAIRELHLIAESGRTTRSGNPYETNVQLTAMVYSYDVPPS